MFTIRFNQRNVTKLYQSVRSMSSLTSFATVDPDTMSKDEVYTMKNLVNGKWTDAKDYESIVDPMNGDAFIKSPLTSIEELTPFVDSLKSCPKTGLHNPLKNPERYLMYGKIAARAAEMMDEPEVETFFARLVQRVVPKSDAQARAEIVVTKQFLYNFAGDNPRFLARSFGVPGDVAGQYTHGMRWPYGPVAIITPFNFPVEICILQLMGALFMGNKPVMKVDSKVAVAAEQFLRMLHAAGLPMEDVDFFLGDGPVMNELLLRAKPRTTLFTGSQAIAEKLAVDLRGKVSLEDAGFDWKILGPDVLNLEHVAWQCDHDAYASQGQKCSAQSILFMHENYTNAGLENKIASLASKRKLEDFTIGPVITWSTEMILNHVNDCLKIPGSRLAFGGTPLTGHSIPKQYGAVKPTAVHVPIEMLVKDEHFKVASKELFGPFQILTTYTDEQLPLVLALCEKMENHLTAAVVSNDPVFQNEVLASTVNGTTYVGNRARTTGAPQNHWFGPAGDPRGAGIGTPEAIKQVWSCHREIIYDVGQGETKDYTTPPQQ